MIPVDPYDSSPLARFLRAVMATFPLGTWFGVPVRMYWAAAVLMPLLYLNWLGPIAGNGGELLLLVAITFVCTFAIVWTHEMGHIAAGRRYGIPAHLITLSPFGGLAHLGAPMQSPREELVVTLAGPATHLVWLAVVWPLQLVLPDRVLSIGGFYWCPLQYTLAFLVQANAWLLVFNLLPIYPLDGGRCLRALLALRWHPNLATMWAGTIGIVGGVMLAVYGFTRPGFARTILLVIGVSCVTGSLEARRAARHVLVYERRGPRYPWEADGDAWKHGVRPERASKLSWFQQWRVKRAVKKAKAAAIEAAAFDREVDRILGRVHEVGMTGLTEQERAVLKRASKRRGRTG
ncbi:MAG: M50 family metallopeptidase [Planctomycetes bacterium]|nr:M50 family metallopeptidase [Planctomycetota bacterium]